MSSGGRETWGLLQVLNCVRGSDLIVTQNE